MAQAKNIFLNDSDKDKLVEIKGKIIESVVKATVSSKMKNEQGVGDAASGSVTYDRFKNSVVSAYGTARTAGKGEALKNSGKVTNNIDDAKEITEEFQKSDVDRYGIPSLMEKRKFNHAQSMAVVLDKIFFEKAVSEGTAISGLTASDPIQETIEKVIQTIETIENDWVEGVPREIIEISLKPSVYGKLQNYIDPVENSITGAQEYLFHGVKVYSNGRQTKDVVAMAHGAIAQDVNVYDYDPTRIPLTNAVECSLFFDQGTKAIMPDLVFFGDLS